MAYRGYSFDGGVIIFPIVIAGASACLHSARINSSSLARQGRAALAVGHAFGVLGFGVGLIIGNPKSDMGAVGYRAFTAAIAVMWLGTGIWFCQIQGQLADLLTETKVTQDSEI